MFLNFIKKFDRIINEGVFNEWYKLNAEYLEDKDTL